MKLLATMSFEETYVATASVKFTTSFFSICIKSSANSLVCSKMKLKTVCLELFVIG